MTLVSEASNSTTMEETSTQSQEAQEVHRKLQCHECLQLKKTRKELKRVKQELRAARQLAYSEQQRAQQLQEQLDLSATEVTDLKRKLVRLERSISGPVEGWVDVCVDFQRRTRRRPNKARGITWQRRYLVVRRGRLYICKGAGQWDAAHGLTDTVVIDIDDSMTISSPGSDDPEVFLLNRDHQKVIKISYHRHQPSESSSVSDCSESPVIEPPTGRVVMLEAPSVEEKQNWMAVLTKERAATTGCQEEEELIDQHPGGHSSHHQLTGSIPDDEVDVNSNFRLRRAYVLKCLKVRHDSDWSHFSSTASSVVDLENDDSCTDTPKCFPSEDDDSDVTDAHDDYETETDMPQQRSDITDQRQTFLHKVGKIHNSEEDCKEIEAQSNPAGFDIVVPVLMITKQFCQFDEIKMAALLLSVVVAIAILLLMSQAV